MARCINIDNGHEKILPSSLGSVSPDGRWGIGYSFARVQKCMPGYGYIQDIEGDKLQIKFDKAGDKKVVSKFIILAEDIY